MLFIHMDPLSYRLVCQPTSTCTNRNQTFNRTEFKCCEGFTTRPREQSKQYDYYQSLYYQFKPVQTLPEGCPRGTLNNHFVESIHT